jgi:hypothetical protein
MTALELGPVSQHWIDAGFRGQDATLERLRVDRGGFKPPCAA